MKIIASLLFFCSIVLPMVAQNKNIITVKAGTRLFDYFPFNERYRYPEFREGTVFLKDNTQHVALLNYNILVGEMEFIQKKDTLALINKKNLDHIIILQDTFYFENGYHEVIAGRAPLFMTLRQMIKIVDTQKEGAYGTKSSSSSISSYENLYDGTGHTYKLVVKEDVLMERKSDYFLGNNKDGFVLYRKSNVFKLFPNNKPEIEDYFKKNRIDFKNPDDLKRLTVFLYPFHVN